MLQSLRFTEPPFGLGQKAVSQEVRLEQKNLVLNVVAKSLLKEERLGNAKLERSSLVARPIPRVPAAHDERQEPRLSAWRLAGLDARPLIAPAQSD